MAEIAIIAKSVHEGDARRVQQFSAEACRVKMLWGGSMASSKAINGFVLAGGESRRMGRDKALIHLGSEPLVLRAAGLLEPFANEVALIAPRDRYTNLGLRVVSDQWPDKGPLAAICTGLLRSSADWNIFLACDLPLISSRFIQYLVKRILKTRSDAVVPRTEEGWQPLSAAFHSRCRTPFVRALEAGRRSVIGLFDEVRVDVIGVDELANAGLSDREFANMNTPEDWKRIQKLLKGAR